MITSGGRASGPEPQLAKLDTHRRLTCVSKCPSRLGPEWARHLIDLIPCRCQQSSATGAVDQISIWWYTAIWVGDILVRITAARIARLSEDSIDAKDLHIKDQVQWSVGVSGGGTVAATRPLELETRAT